MTVNSEDPRSLLKQDIVWVDTDSLLAELCARWQSNSMLALDTEFIRTNTYYPKSALIQVNDGDANYLIDAVAISNWESFVELLQSDSVIKVLHACSEDLEVFSHLCGALPTKLLDTQIAAAFFGFGFSIGYAGIVEQMLGLHLPKGESRSNWLQRPLSPAQVTYAALDVEHLYEVARQMLAKLQGSVKKTWVNEECVSLIEAYMQAQDPAQSVRRVKGAWRLDALGYAILKELCLWRELEARARDLPRNFVIKEKALLQIAELKPQDARSLGRVHELSEKTVRRYAPAILEVVENVTRNFVDGCELPAPRPLNTSQKQKVKVLREAFKALSETLGVAPELLARKKDYEHIVRAVAQGETGEAIFPETLSGWRQPLVKKTVLAVL